MNLPVTVDTGDQPTDREIQTTAASFGTENYPRVPSEVYGVLHRLAYDIWGDALDVKNLILKPLKGAMTNHVFECHWPHQKDRRNPRRVLVRIYGDGCEMFFRRDNEILTFERMSQLGQGPRLLARFPNGRVEEFLNARTLQATDLRDPTISRRIAAKLREFHQLDMPGAQEPELWERLRLWVCKAVHICPMAWVEEFQVELLKEEINELESKLSVSERGTGFCHNDLQYGNIMMDEIDGSVTIIDYEYATFNPIAFDIANHFCEMTANYHSDMPHVLDFSNYPGYEERFQFIDAYLDNSDSGTCSVSLFQKESLLQEVERYTLASHLLWGVWGILYATFSDIDFDYREYARQRLNLYHHYKPLLL